MHERDKYNETKCSGFDNQETKVRIDGGETET